MIPKALREGQSCLRPPLGAGREATRAKATRAPPGQEPRGRAAPESAAVAPEAPVPEADPAEEAQAGLEAAVRVGRGALVDLEAAEVVQAANKKV